MTKGMNFLLAGAALAAVIAPQAAMAQQRRFDVPAQPATKSIIEFARQAGVQITGPAAKMRAIRTKAVKGTYEVRDALRIMLANTGLKIVADDGATITLAAEAAPATPSQPAADPDPAPPQAAVDLDADIIVTGSRLDRGDLRSPNPVQTVRRTEIEQSGVANISELLNRLPAVRPSVTPLSSTNNQNFQGDFLDLRGLGVTRTLVMIDGQRVVPSHNLGVVDIGLIPQAIISGVDVVTGGASAAWGSGAVAGVVNFRTETKLRGLRASVQGGITDHNDNRNFLASAAWGTGFDNDRGSFVVSGEWFQTDGIRNFHGRKWHDESWGRINNPAYTPTNSEPQLLLLPGVTFSNNNFTGLITGGPLVGTAFGPGGQPYAFHYGSPVSGGAMIGGDGLKYSDIGSMLPKADRKAIYANLSYEFSPALKLRASVNWGTIDYINSFQNRFSTTIRRDNAFLPAATAAAMDAAHVTSFPFARTLTNETRGWFDMTVESETVRGVLTAQGDLGGGWSYDAYYTHGETKRSINGTDVSITARVTQALDSIIDPVTGRAVCRDPAARAAGCVPVNPFGPGSVSADAANYYLGAPHNEANLAQDAAAVAVRGEPFSIGGRGVGVALGGEFRAERAGLTGDAGSLAGIYDSGRVVPWSAKSRVWEGFAEMRLPLVADASWAKRIDVSLAGRVTNYSNSGTVWTWKAGAVWDVTKDLRFRATRSRDIRAPAMEDLYLGSFTALPSVLDVVTGSTYQITQISSGNPRLVPETANTLVVGMVLSPSFIPRLQLSVDLYDITIDGAIVTPTVQAIADRCARGETALCSLITRDSGTNLIKTISVAPQNLQRIATRGVDIEARYSRPLFGGTLNLRGLVTYVDRVRLTDGGTVQEYVDSLVQPNVTAIGGTPHWRYNLNANFQGKRMLAGATVRYVGGGAMDNSYTAKSINILRAGGQTVVDLNAAYDILPGGKVQWFGTINNVFDAAPPIVGFSVFGTNRSLYEILGRSYTTGLRFRF